MKKYLFLKKERFSIRKFSVGAASVLIGTSLFAGAGSAHAEETTVATSAKTVDLHYLNEKELTADEQKLLENFQKSHTVEADDVAYYYVYRPSQKSLPNTGSTEIAGLAVAGATLLVAALVLSRKNKRLAVTLFALGSGGLLTTTVLADSQLAQFFENAQVAVNGDIPQPKAIDGYEFTGYFYRRKESKSTTTPVVPQTDKDSLKPIAPLDPFKPVEPAKEEQTAKGDQSNGGSANVEPALPEFPIDKLPVETAKGDQSKGGSANVEPALPEFKIPTEAKGDQTGKVIVNDQPTPKDGRDEFEDYMLDGKAGTPEAKVRELNETTTLPFNTVTKEDSTLEKGQTRVEVVGQNGQKVTKIREFYTVSRDGQETVVFRDVISEQETPAVDQVVLVGTKEVTPIPTPDPDPSPVDPTPTPDPDPSPVDPTPTPDPDPSPVDPTPTPDPDPTPVDPTPTPQPDPTPVDPTPTPQPDPVPQPKVETVEIEPTVRYEADPSREVGSENITIPGEKGLQTTTTIYERDAQTGDLKEKPETVVTKPAGETVIKVAAKPTEKRENLPTIYNGDINQAFGTPDITTAGAPKVTTTTYTVNPQTGQVTPHEEVTDAGQAPVITKGIQSREVTEALPTVYRGDDSQDLGTETETPGTLKVTTIAYQVDAATGVVTPIETLTNPGSARVVVKGIKPTTRPEDLPVVYKRSDEQALGTDTTTEGTPKVTTTTYTVDAQTGLVTPTEKVTQEGTAKVITKGTRPKVEETPIKFTTTYKADAATPYNTKVEETKGVDGKTVKTTTYSLNEQTGEVTLNTPVEDRTEPVTKVVKVGNVQTTTAEIAITEQAERVKDPDLEKGKTRVVTAGEVGESTTTITYTVDPQTGALSNPQTETVTTKEMKQRVIAEGTKEILEKKVDFNDVTKRELYRVADNGELEPVTGFETAPTDTSKYILKLTRQNHKDVLLPVSSITAAGESFKVVSTGEEFFNDEGMTVDKIVVAPGTYTKFADLIADMKKNPNGTFKLASDLVADDSLAESATAYLNNFTGTLESVDDTKLFAIKGLTRPLFDTLTNATVKNLKLEDLKVTSAKAAALALTTTGGTIENVHAKGDVTGIESASGLVQESNNTAITKVSTSGNITLNRPNIHIENSITGGVIGKISGGSLTKVLSEAAITANVPTPMTNKYVGGVVGQAVNATFNELVGKGSVGGTFNSIYIQPILGGVVGQASSIPSATKIVAMAQVSQGNAVAGAGTRFWFQYNNVEIVDGVSTGNNTNMNGTKKITTEAAETRIASWGILPAASSNNGGSNQGSSQSDAPLNYTTVKDAEASRAIAYENTSKLLPFYDADTIVRYGNKVATNDKLYTTKVTAVVPLAGETPVGLTSANASQITQILIHYADGTVEKRAVKAEGAYKNSKVYEYQLGEDLLFTPEQLLTDRGALITELVTEFKKITFDSEEMQKAVKLAEANAGRAANAQYQMNDLFWKSTFNNVQENIESILGQLLSNDTVLGEGAQLTQATKQKLLEKKAEVLVGLSYLARLYDIHYGDLSLKNILTYRPDFYGKKQDVVDWLASFADLSFRDLQVHNNVATFVKQMSRTTGSSNLLDFLEKNKAKFAPSGTMAEWFKSTTKATVYEVKSKIKPDEDVSLYSWLTSNNNYYAHYILPLLNLRDDSIYATTNITFMSFGIKDRHIPQATRQNPTEYAQALKELVEVKIPDYAQRWATFTDMWYNVVDPSVKQVLLKPRLSTYGGYYFPGEGNNGWLSPYETNRKAMEDFFAATGNWFDDDAKIAAYAYTATDLAGYHTELNFRRADLISNGGASTLTHEFTHAMDFLALLDGNKRRPGQDAESFAMGLLESTQSNTDYYYGFNFIQDYNDKPANHNQRNTRFQSAEDIGQYMSGVFDLMYSLDSVEAEEMLKLPKNDVRAFLDKIELVYDNPQKPEHAQDRIRALTDAEWNAMNLQSINDLIDNNLVKRDSLVNIRRLFNHGEANNYTYVSLYSPIYGATQNTYGTGGGLQFRKTALELLAAKGWHEGFIPYASNKLEAQAKSEGAVYSDEYVFKKIIGSEYNSYADLKKDKYAKALAKVKAGNLKTITIDLKGQTVVIDSYAKLQQLISEALKKDVENARKYGLMQEMEILKSAIVKAVHHQTNDFTTSIYK